MYRPTLDRNAAMISDPGMDQVMKPLSYWVDGLLATVGADGIVDPAEQEEIVRLQVGLQTIGQQRLAEMGAQDPMGPPSNETSEFGSGEDTEPADNYGAEPGAEFTTSM